MAANSEAIDYFLSTEAGPSPPRTSLRTKGGKQPKQSAVEAFFAQPDTSPSPQDPGWPSSLLSASPLFSGKVAGRDVTGAAEPLKRLVTEGLPAAVRAFVERQGAPTLAQRLPEGFRYTPIPGALDIAERLFRLPSSVGAGAAEVGPEQAKPLTEAGVANALWFASPIAQALRARFPRPAPAVPAAPPAPPGQLALPGRTALALPSGTTPGQRALPQQGGGPFTGATPTEQPIVPRTRFRDRPYPPATEADRIAEARAAGFGPRAARPESPAEVPGPALEGELLDAQGRPIRAAGGPDVERERLRSLYKGRAPRRIDLTGAPGAAQAPEPGPAGPGAPGAGPGPVVGPSGRPSAPLGVFGDLGMTEEEVTALTQAAKPAPDLPPYARAAEPAAPVDVLDRSLPKKTKALVNGEEWTKIGRNSWKGPAGEQFTGETLAKMRSGTETAVAQASAQPPLLTPAKRSSSFTFEYGVPNLDDPRHVRHLVEARGGLKVTQDLAGELRDVPGFLKNSRGQTLDQMAESLVDTYPSLGGGDRQAVKEQMIRSLSGATSFKAKPLEDLAALEAKAYEGMVTELETSPMPGEVPPSVWKEAMDFFKNVGQDESGLLNLRQAIDTWKRNWKTFRERFPMEEAVRKARPDSPVISEVERWNAWLSDLLQARVQLPWHKGVRKADVNVMKQAEETAVNEWLAAGQTQAAGLRARRWFDPAVQQSMHQRDVLFDQTNRSRAYFGLPPVERNIGPYLPRDVVGGRDAVSLRGQRLGVGTGLQTTPPGHTQARSYSTYRAGEAAGLEYEDPRNEILLRDWDDLKIRATHRLFWNLERKGTLFRDEAAARAASPTGSPWIVEDAPGGTWWTTTEAEAKFLRQNLTESPRGPMTSLIGYGNSLFRNPNLVNPAPHVVKNMAVKALLADGPVGISKLARDAVEWARSSNPQLLREFNEAMPFSESGKTAGDILGAELRKGPISDAIRASFRALGMVNRPSQVAIFKYADPAMRYSLFKHYRAQGKGVYEAGNHAWTDLIRYGTRSEVVDRWKSWPLNFFVPWRFGTFSALVKQATNHPVRTTLLIAAVDYLREVRYRQNGKWTHLPWDYVESPIAHVVQSKDRLDFAKNALSEGALTTLFGPGGAFAASQMDEMLKVASGRADPRDPQQYARLMNMFWGLQQIYNLPQEFKKGDYSGMLATLMLGEHNALTYEPKRLGPGYGLIPESVLQHLPGMQKSPLVQEAERLQAQREKKLEQIYQRRGTHPSKSIEDRLRRAGYLQ